MVIMIHNDAQRLALRPQIDLDTTKSKPEEAFQNDTLRPILKMQHALLTQVFASYIRKRKDVYFKLAAKDRPEWISTSIRSDLRLRNQLCGMITGHFTTEEMACYLETESEVTRRVTDLIIQRLQSEVFEQEMVA